MRLGSLCSGYGGLDLATEAHYGAETVWVCEYNPQASAVLAHRFPVPNLSDLTAVDWSTVEPVDVLTAGYPCQPFSHAGLRKGTTDDRHIWPHIANAVRVLRPGRVVLENVAGHLSLGFGDVLGDLAALGYDTRWCCVRASDAGAPHRRERVFIVARDANGERQSPVGGKARWAVTEPARVRLPATDPDGGAGPQRDEWPATGRGVQRGYNAERLGAAAADTEGIGSPDGQISGNASGQHERAVTRTSHRSRRRSSTAGVPILGGTTPVVAAGLGPYGPAIERWEHVTGRSAPAPTDNAGRLNPRFVEWMMGLDDGWVTDLIPQRTHALRILGNGVVPQQAALALAMLDPHRQEVAA